MVTLIILTGIMSLDSESWLFTKMKSEFKTNFPVLIDPSNYNRRKRSLNPFINSISDWVASEIHGQNKKVILDSIPLPILCTAEYKEVKFAKKICKFYPLDAVTTL